MARVLNLIWATLLEIFDESAYERHLLRTGAVRSAKSYAEYLRESRVERESKPRCC